MGNNALNGLGIYHVDTGVWEWEDTPDDVSGSNWGFDENLGVLVGTGKRYTPYGYYFYKYAAVATSVAEVNTNGFEVSQNFPNPFTSETEIALTSAIAGKIQMNIYNTLGELIQEKQIEVNPGVNRFSVFANDMPAGVFTYSIESAFGIVNKQMVVIK